MAADVFVELKANIQEFQARMGEARAEMTATQKHGEGAFSGLAKAGQGALFGLGTAAVGLGVLSIHMADEFEASHAKLVAALTAAGKSFEQFKAPIDATDKAMEKLGFVNADTEAALSNMTIALQDPTKAMSMMGLAADIARARNIDLATASVLVEKAAEGQLRPLKQAGIDLPVVAATAEKVAVAQNHLAAAQANVTAYLTKFPDAANAASKAHAGYEKAVTGVTTAQTKLNDLTSAGGQIIAALTQRFGGQAAASAETFGGKMQVLKAQTEDLAKNIGLKLIPVIERLMTTTASVVTWLEKHRAVAEALAVAIGGPLLIAMGAFIVSLFTADGALAFITLPILAVMAAIALLSVGVFELATHWKQVWADIQQWTQQAIDFVKSHIYLLIPILITPIGIFLLLAAAAVELARNWDRIFGDITSWTTAAWNVVQSVTMTVVGAVSDFVTKELGFLSQWWHDHMQAISDITTVVWAAVKVVVTEAMKVIAAVVTVQIAVVKNIITVTLGIIQATWRNVWNAIRDYLAIVWAAIKAVVDIYIHTVLDVIGIVLDLITGKWGKAWTDVKDLLATTWNDMVAFLKTFVSKFADMGKNIMEGFINGVKSVDVGSILSDVWSGLVGSAKSILGIKSPSTVFYDIGKNLALGLLNGVKDTVANGSNSILGGIKNLFGGGGGAIGGGGPIGPGPAGSGGVLMAQVLYDNGFRGAALERMTAIGIRESGGNSQAHNFNPSTGDDSYGYFQINYLGALKQAREALFGPASGLLANPELQGHAAWVLSNGGTNFQPWTTNRGLSPEFIAQADQLIAGIHTSGGGRAFDRGGILPPGFTMAFNGTGQNEYVSRSPSGSGGGTTVNNFYFNGTFAGTAGMKEVADIVKKIYQTEGRAGVRLGVA